MTLRLSGSPRLFHPRSSLAIATLVAVAAALPALAHSPTQRSGAFKACKTSAHPGDKTFKHLSAPYNQRATYDALKNTPLWKQAITPLWVNIDKSKPCFAMSDTPVWGKVVGKIPADVVGLQISDDGRNALVYVSGIPDYMMETPKLFASFKPGNTYNVFKVSSEPKPDASAKHELASRGAIGFFVNGVSIFNYTDTFSYNDKGVWSYDANVAEASIVNSDVSHATPSDLPQFPKSRGIFHNHQMSIELLHQLKDPYYRGVREHSRLVGFALDSYPIYGPLGYSSKDKASGIKTLQSSYVKRNWLTVTGGGTGNRSSVPDWLVRHWDASHEAGSELLNIFAKKKSDILFTDGGKEGPVTYSGDDAKLAAEIASLNKSKTLLRDTQGYVYWEAEVRMPNGKTAKARNYVLKSSDLWGATVGQEILPVSYQVADKDKFLFKATVGAFAEDYEFIAGYGDLDFYNGIDSYIPERGQSVYHYVASFSAKVSDRKRLTTASFPYVVGVQYRGMVDAFNAAQDDKAKAKYLVDNASRYKTVFDLGVIGRGDDGKAERGSVIETWRKMLGED